MEEAEEEVGVKISCVISDAFLWFCCEIAEEKGLSWFPIWTANVVSLSAAFYTDVLRTKFGVLKQGRGDELVDCVPGFSNVRLRDIVDCVPGLVTESINSIFDQMVYKMGLMLPKAKAVVVNTFEKLSPTITNDLKSKMRLLCVGPFPLMFPSEVVFDKYDCLPWLDKQKEKSVVYISFGTVMAPPPHEFVALAEALECAGFPFLWSINDSNKGHLPSWFIDRVKEDEAFGKIVQWAPQMKVLGHPSVGGFVTHCGWNSVLESIVNGVPLICRPMLGDQRLNQRFIECIYEFGVGVEGGVFTKGGMIKALHRVLSSNEGKEMRKSVDVLRELAEE
uniref:2-hydroxyflavanone C-glucosyltransferase n=1 Tax=Chenopodium quinoa TaxID=63459 RepID=A0A803MRV5_CHEQI